MERACESCAVVDDELAPVRRVYVDPERPRDPAGRRVLDVVELWCISCRSQYPHEPADGQEDDEDDGEDTTP